MGRGYATHVTLVRPPERTEDLAMPEENNKLEVVRDDHVHSEACCVVQPPPGCIRLQITMDLTSLQTTVGGPLDRRALCYTMLEMARDIIHDHAIKAKSSGLILPPRA